MSTFTMVSERTARQGCSKCGSKDVYKLQTESGRIVWGNASSLRGTPRGTKLELDEDSPILHRNTCSATRPDPYEHMTTTEEVVSPSYTDPIETEAPLFEAEAEVEAESKAKDPRLELLESLLNPSMDPEQIRAMVKEELGNMVFPTSTVVVDGTTGESHPIEGLTHNRLGDVIERVSRAIPTFLTGPAGSGKSTIAKQVAKAMFGPTAIEDGKYGEISCAPDVLSSSVFGYRTADGQYVRTLFRDRVEYGGVFFFDEVAALNSAIAVKVNAIATASPGNDYVEFPDGMVKVHADFRLIAADNTVGTGPDRVYTRGKLDGAFLNRFVITHIGYDEALERAACSAIADAATVERVLYVVRKLRAATDEHKLPLVFSPRNSINACKMLMAGIDHEQVMTEAVRHVTSDKDWQTLGGDALTLAA